MSGTLGNLHISLGLDSVQFSNGLTQAANQTKKFANNTQRTLIQVEKSFQAMEQASKWSVRQLFAGIGADGVSGLLRYANGYTEISNKLKIVSSSSTEAAASLDSVFSIALKTRQSVNGAAQVYQRFAQNAETLGLSQKNVANLTEIVSKAIALSGGSAASSEAAITQFGQALAAGVLRGDEFNSVMEQAPGLSLAIANGLGVTIAQLRKMANEGKLTTDVLIPALEKAKDKVDSDFSKMSVTVEQAFENLRTSATKWIGETDSSIGITENLSKGILALSDNFDIVAKSALSAVAAMALLKGSKQLHNYAENVVSQKTAIAEEKQLAQATRERAIAMRETTAATLQQTTVEYQAMKAKVENLQATLKQTIAERELIAVQIQGASNATRIAGLQQIAKLKAQEDSINKMLITSEKSLVTAKNALKIAYAENAVTQSAANAGLVRSGVLMTTYRGIVKATTAELHLMKTAFLSNPIMLGIMAVTTLASFAGYWFNTAEATEEATRKSKEYAESVDVSKAALEQMSAVALAKQAKDLQEAQNQFKADIENRKRRIAELNERIAELNKGWANYGADSWYALKSEEEERIEIQNKLIDLNAELENAQKSLDTATEKLTKTQEQHNIALGNASAKQPDLTGKTQIFSGTLDELGISADIANGKLQSMFATLFGQGTLAIKNGNSVVAYASEKLQADIDNLTNQKALIGLTGEALYREQAKQDAKKKGYTKDAATYYENLFADVKLAQDQQKIRDSFKGDLSKLRQDEVLSGLKGAAKYRKQAEYDAANKGYTGAEAQQYIEQFTKTKLAEESSRSSSKKPKTAHGIDYIKQYTEQIKDMQQRLAALNDNAAEIKIYGQTSQYQEVNKLTQDIAANAEKYKNFGLEGVAKLKALAAQIDSANQKVAIAQFGFDNSEQLASMEFELTLLGKTQREQEIIQYNHQLDLEAARLKVGMTKENIALLDQEISKLKERYVQIKSEEEKYRSSATLGIKQGFNDIHTDVTNVAGNMRNITVAAFGSMSDALTDFVMTGKADFADMATSIMKDISNMIIKMMLFNAIKSAGSAMGFDMSSFGGASSGGYAYGNGYFGFSEGGFTGLGGKYTPAGIVHKGEYVLTKEATSRIGLGYLNYLNYGNAFRGRGYANGGLVGSANTGYTRHIQGGGNNISVKIINNGSQVDANVSQSQNGNQTEITIELMQAMQKIADNRIAYHQSESIRSGGFLQRNRM